MWTFLTKKHLGRNTEKSRLMPQSPALSFCIPSYNRKVQVRELVESLLSLPDDDIEVIVLDNASTDGTFNELNQICDSRFKLATNAENRGALFNMVNVFGYATGDYVVYSTDQDRVNLDKISKFKMFLKSHPEVGCGFCEFDIQLESEPLFFDRGYGAVSAIAYKGRHPTGYFFKNELLRSVCIAERFSDFNVVDLFPLEFAFAEVALIGDGAVYRGGVFSPNTGEDVVLHKSSTTNGASKYAFFAPAARLKLAVSYSCHVEQLKLTRIDTTRLQVQIFVAELMAATFGYKKIMKNSKLCIHYQMELRHVGYLELLRIGIMFVCGYISQRFGKFNNAALGFFAVLAVHVCRKLAKRFSDIRFKLKAPISA